MTVDEKVRYAVLTLVFASTVLLALGLHISPLTSAAAGHGGLGHYLSHPNG